MRTAAYTHRHARGVHDLLHIKPSLRNPNWPWAYFKQAIATMLNLRFSLKAMFVAITLLAIGFGIGLRRATQQHRVAVSLLRNPSVSIATSGETVRIASEDDPAEVARQNAKRAAIGTYWLQSISGVEVIALNLSEPEQLQINEDLRCLPELNRLTVWVGSNVVNDLCREVSVDTLILVGPSDFDSALSAAAEMKIVKTIKIVGARATQEGFLRIKQRHIREIILDGQFQYSQEEMEHLRDIAADTRIVFDSYDLD